VVISLTASGIHEEHHAQLLTGLNNYRECGYRIALNIGHHISSDRVLQLIKRLAPDYVSLTAPDENYTCLSSNATLATALKKLQELVTSLKGQTILQNVDRSEQSGCATQVGFDFVQGSYYEKSPDMLKRPKNNVKNYSYID
jgi:EAL domain-containing protein (putative c-di-GMP-specific phosphodiesterase class I)